MSGETSTNTTGRFSSQTNHYASNNNKKYPGSPKSPSLNSSLNNNTGGNRNLHARQRLLASKISAPRPINLPSLRREHASGTEISSSPGSQHGWGSTNSSPSIPHSEVKADQNVQETPNNTKTNSDPPITTRTWATPSTTKTQAPNDDFPTAAESTTNTKKPSTTDDNEYLKYVSSDPNHTAWDEMVNEEMEDFSIEVVEFDDGFKAPLPTDTDPSSPVVDTVSPSERFNDDYDRSYTSQYQKSNYNRYEHNDHHMHNGYKPFRRSVDHGYNNTRYFEHRRSNKGEGERRPSNTDRWPRRESAEYHNRRPSHDKNSNSYHPPVSGPSLHQRTRRTSEQSFKSEHSHEDTSSLQPNAEPNTEEITVAQKNVMLTAAERAKRRFDEQEAEYKAAAERARQKAAALAEQAQDQDKPTVTDTDTAPEKQERAISSSLPDTSKPWNLVAAHHDASKPVHKPLKPYETSPKILTHASDDKPTTAADTTEQTSTATDTTKQTPTETDTTEKAPTATDTTDHQAPSEKKVKDLAQDEKDWAEFVMKKRNNETTSEIEGATNGWHSYATRLQQRDGNKYNYTYHQPPEVHDFSQNEEWGTLPNNLVNGRPRTGWVKQDEYARGRGRSRHRTHSGEHWRPDGTKKRDEPGTIEILKHEPLSNKERVTRLLHTSTTSPLFPQFLAKLTTQKPTHLCFTVDTMETPSTPDLEKDDYGTVSMEKSASTISSTSSPSKSHGNSNFPLLVYQQDACPSTDEQRTLGIYFMPPQQQQQQQHYIMAPYPQAGTGNAPPIYFPSLPCPQQQQRSKYRHEWNTEFQRYKGASTYRKRGPRGKRYTEED